MPHRDMVRHLVLTKRAPHYSRWCKTDKRSLSSWSKLVRDHSPASRDNSGCNPAINCLLSRAVLVSSVTFRVAHKVPKEERRIFPGPKGTLLELMMVLFMGTFGQKHLHYAHVKCAQVSFLSLFNA